MRQKDSAQVNGWPSAGVKHSPPMIPPCFFAECANLKINDAQAVEELKTKHDTLLPNSINWHWSQYLTFPLVLYFHPENLLTRAREQ